MRVGSQSRKFVLTCPPRTLVALGVLGLWCSAVHAGLTYSFTRVEAGSALPNNSSGRVWLDGFHLEESPGDEASD